MTLYNRLAVVVLALFCMGTLWAYQPSAAQESGSVPDQPTTMEVPGIPATFFTNGHPADMEVIAQMCDCSSAEVGVYVDPNGVINLDGAVIVPMDRILQFDIEPGYTALLFDWSGMTIVEMSNEVQEFNSGYNRAIVFNGNLPERTRGILADVTVDMNEELCGEADNCSFHQSFNGVGRSFSFDPDDYKKWGSESCDSYTIPEGIVVQFQPTWDETAWTAGPQTLPHQCGVVWVYFPSSYR